ncbi:glycosyltransferase family 39 protein [Microbacterium sp. USHLN186]|uniref:glycosyltransferase family 39 protein n=1 Tax=Microbacterium sp. USHLN186 TaxID=3081286 RepID=UPI003017DCFF
MTVTGGTDARDARVGWSAALRPTWVVPLAVGVAVALIVLNGAGVPSYWGDEAASVMSAQRTLPSMLRELSAVDAVHGIYYAVLHVWIGLFGSGEWATRTLSVMATGVFAAGLVVLGRRWAGQRTGVVAGLLVAVIPRSSALAMEARGYAITEALSVWLVILFVVLRARRTSPSRWIGYGVLSGAASWFFLYLLLVPLALIATVVISVAVRRRRGVAGEPVADLIRAGITAAVVALPIITLAALQRHQVAFLGHRGYLSVTGVLVTPWFAAVTVAVVFWALMAWGVVHGLRDRADRSWVPLALAWLLVPALVMITLHLLVSPTYDSRYLAISLGAAALLAARGITGLLGVLSAHRLALIGGAAALSVLVLGVTVPRYLHQRTPYAKDGGADFRAVADTIAQQAHPGDAVLFGQGPRPSRTARLAYRLYPDSFGGLRDPQLVTAFDARAGLWDELAPVQDIAAGLRERTVWLIESKHAATASADLAALRRHGYSLITQQRLHRTMVYELVKETPRDRAHAWAALIGSRMPTSTPSRSGRSDGDPR